MTARKLVYKSDIPKLERAIELVQAGWVQGGFVRTRNGETSYCIAGALSAVTDARTRQYHRLRHAIIAELHSTDLLAFNDAPGRKKYEVIRVMRRALVKARELAGVEA